MRFANTKQTEAECQRLAQDLNLSVEQIKTTLRSSASGTVSDWTGLILFLLLIFIAGYLLIDNILFLSISRDIRFYGLLKALGCTPRQLRRIVFGQALLLCGIGIPAGLAAGAALSGLLIPMAMSVTLFEAQTVVAFDPLIYFGAGLFALTTVLLGTVRPARRACRVTPVEALRYVEPGALKKKRKVDFHGRLPVMAWRNVFRDRRRATAVMLSLFLGLTVFLITTCLVRSQSAEYFIDVYLKNDFMITGQGRWDESRISPELTSSVLSLENIHDVQVVTKAKMLADYDAERFAEHLDDAFNKWIFKGIDKANIQADQFTGNVLGVSDSLIQKSGQLADNFDWDSFHRGEIGLILSDYPEHYQSVPKLDFTLDARTEKHSVLLAGSVPWSELDITGGLAPNLIVSEQALESWTPDVRIAQISFNAVPGMQESVSDQLRGLTRGTTGIFLISREEQIQALEESTRVMGILGLGISSILGMIGILNFVNIMGTSILSRRHELAMLESIGMTNTQIQKMVVWEGLIYALIPIGLVLSLGNILTQAAFRQFKQMADYAVLSYPGLELFIVLLLVLGLCLIVPLVTFRRISRHSVVERLREAD